MSPRISPEDSAAAVLPALLGIALVAQLAGRQPEVIFSRDLGSASQRDPPSGHGSGGDWAATSKTSRMLSHGSSGDEDDFDDLPRRGDSVPMLPSQSNVGIPQLQIGSSEDLGQQLPCFGIPAKSFAKLMLPDHDDLCNRPFYLELDAGRRQTSHPHGPWSHLLFVSFPCNVAELSKRSFDLRRAESAPPKEKDLEKVQSFNVVHVLDSRLAGRREKYTSTLWEVSAHLSRALVSEESRCGYLSQEVRRLSAVPLEEQLGLATEVVALAALEEDGDWPLAPRGLDRLLTETFEGVYRKGYCSLRVHGSILCQVCVFPKHEAPAPPSCGHALALTGPRHVLQQELPADSADIVRRVVEAISPKTPLAELMVSLALPLGTLQRVAQHLVYWKKARVIEPFTDETRVMVAPGVDAEPVSQLSREFQEWLLRNRSKSVGSLSLSEVLAAFSGGRELKDVQKRLSSSESSASTRLRSADFDNVLEWLVARNLLMQLGKFYHFLPQRASATARQPGASRTNRHGVPADIRQEWPSLNQDELRLLSLRAEDFEQLRFLCRFAVEFARGHCRADGCRFAALFESEALHGRGQARLRAERLLADNADIFVSYSCRS